MRYKSTWFSKRDLERLCRSVANLCGIELTADTLCDVIDDHAAEGGYGANVERKLVYEGVSLTDAEILLSDLADSEIDDNDQARHQLCQEGRMGKRVGRDWLITPEDIERNRERNKPGRPPGRAVTQDNAEDIRAEVGFLDLAAEVQVGQRVSVHRFRHEGGQSGCLLVVHADKDGRVDRAGISFGGPGTWGDWDNDSQTVRLDDADAEGLAVVYDTQGRRVVE